MALDDLLRAGSCKIVKSLLTFGCITDAASTVAGRIGGWGKLFTASSDVPDVLVALLLICPFSFATVTFMWDEVISAAEAGMWDSVMSAVVASKLDGVTSAVVAFKPLPRT